MQDEFSGNLYFGDFELDRRRHELRKSGRRVALQEQPYQILSCLLERPDELVTREQLRERLWPPDTYVEYEKSINVAVMKLREALGDSAEDPRFIVTLPRLGYRFIAPVTDGAPGSERPARLEPADRLEMERGELEAAIAVALPRAPEGYPAPREVELSAPAARGRSSMPRRVLAAAALLVVAMVVGYIWRKWESSGNVPIRSLAVLPFVDQSPHPGEEYLAAGLTEELITSLAQIGSLRVTSHTSSEALRGSSESLTLQARRLGVDGIIEGSVAHSGSRIRVTAQLIHAASDRHLWAGRYEREESAILDLQNEIARDITREIEVTLAPREARRLAHRRAVDPGAYREYLLGRFQYNKRSVDGFVKAVRHFRRAIQIDPESAEAHSGLGIAYLQMGVLGILIPNEASSLARAEAELALRFDPELAEAHATRGRVLMSDEWRWQEAEAELMRARELAPSTANTHGWIAMAAQGHNQAALQEAQRLLELDPLSHQLSLAVAYVHYLGRDYDAAIVQYRKALEIEPDSQEALQGLANSEASAGLPEAAIQTFVRWAQAAGLAPGEVDALRERGAAAGLPGIWRFLLALEARDEVERDQIWPYRRATLHARLGETEAAFRWLNTALTEDALRVIFAGSEPAFDSLRRDPRFPEFLRRMNLDPNAFVSPEPPPAR